LFSTKDTTLNTTCVRTEQHRTLRAQTYIFTVPGRLCQEVESVRIHLRQGEGWGTFIAIVVTPPPPTVTGTTTVTNFCF
jgi:hypothetical protein